ncbi:hypothetical protein ACGC1H_004148 [Rhizoctonia solani]
MPLSRLPPEIIPHLIDYLPHPSTISASLVCRAWRLVLLRTLYHSVKLANNSYAVHFANTITSGGVVGLSHHISGLIQTLSIGPRVTFNTYPWIEFAVLEPCLTHLVQLRRFRCYNILSANVNVKFFKLVQTQCPLLESVKLRIAEEAVPQVGPSQLTTLFGFRNLVNYSLHMKYFFWEIDKEALAPLKTLVANCLNLESLKLDFFFGNNGPKVSYDLDVLLDLFGQDLTMPHLHTLHIRGRVEMHIDSLFGPPATGLYRFNDFLSRHPRIRYLKLDCWDIHGLYKDCDIDPDNLGRALPSLRRCSAPDFICAYLVRSTAAAHLEQLEIEREASQLDLSFEALPMPMLRKLEIEAYDFVDVLNIMKHILPVARGLKHLIAKAIPKTDTDHSEFLELLVHARELQTIRIDHPHRVSEKFVEKLKTMYPKIDVFRKRPGRMPIEWVKG